MVVLHFTNPDMKMILPVWEIWIWPGQVSAGWFPHLQFPPPVLGADRRTCPYSFPYGWLPQRILPRFYDAVWHPSLAGPELLAILPWKENYVSSGKRITTREHINVKLFSSLLKIHLYSNASWSTLGAYICRAWDRPARGSPQRTCFHKKWLV